MADNKRVEIQEKIKAQGEIVRKLKATAEKTDDIKQQVYSFFIYPFRL